MPSLDALGNRCTHKVRLHFRSIGTPDVPEFTALQNAQRVYGPNGINIEFASGQSLLLGDVDQITLSVLDTACQWDQDSDEQGQLYGLGGSQGVGATDVLVYYVNRIVKPNGDPLNGCAGHAPTRAAVAVATTGSRWTLAHELGHVLLGSRFAPVHETSPLNLMFAPTTSITANPPGLSATQLAAMRRSAFCVSC
jgi:hypothetical protein